MTLQNRFSGGLLLALAAPFLLLPSHSQDIDGLSVAKFKLYEQFDPGIVQLTEDDMESPLGFEAVVNVAPGGTVNSATVTPPGGSAQPMDADFDEWLVEYGSDAPADLDSQYPNGTYTLNIDTGGGPIVATLDLTGDAYPNPPRVNNYLLTQSINASSAFTLSWDAFTGGTTDDIIEVIIESQSGEVFNAELDGTATSVEIPALTLAAGRIYDLELVFIKVVDVGPFDGIAAYGCATLFEITTSGTPTETNTPWLQSFAPFNGEIDVPVESVVVMQFSEKMSSVIDIAWSGGGVDTNNFTYTWNKDKRTLYCIYNNPAGFPQGANIQWQINPGESGIMRDLAGNSVGENTNSFTTASIPATGANDVDRLYMLKTQVLTQTGATPDHTGWYLFETGFDLNTPGSVTNLSVAAPNSRTFDVRPGWVGEGPEQESGYTDKANLDTFFAPGIYDITLDTAHDGQKLMELEFPADAYPNDPTVTNLGSLNGADPTGPITINWQAYAGADASSAYYIGVYISTDSDYEVYESAESGEPGGLDGTSTSLVIPADTLQPGRTYLVELEFARIVDTDTTSYPGSTALALYSKITEFEITTGGAPIQPQATVNLNGNSASIQVSGGHYTNYRLEGSNDLVNWYQLNYAQTAFEDGQTEFNDWDRVYFTNRYYRAVEVSEEEFFSAPPVSIQGTVINNVTLEPVEGATVSTSLDGNSVVTGADGTFFLQTATSLGFDQSYHIYISKAGYAFFNQSNFWGDKPRAQQFNLQPF